LLDNLDYSRAIYNSAKRASLPASTALNAFSLIYYSLAITTGDDSFDSAYPFARSTYLYNRSVLARFFT
jgi:hypothetical protein